MVRNVCVGESVHGSAAAVADRVGEIRPSHRSGVENGKTSDAIAVGYVRFQLFSPSMVDLAVQIDTQIRDSLTHHAVMLLLPRALYTLKTRQMLTEFNINHFRYTPIVTRSFNITTSLHSHLCRHCWSTQQGNDSHRKRRLVPGDT